MKKLLTYLILLIVAAGCQVEEELHLPDTYNINESYKSDDCSIYQMIFKKKGDYIFRYALSWKCNLLTASNYIAEYERFLQKYKKPFPANEGLIIFEHYYSDKFNNEMIEEISAITESKFKSTVSIKEIDDNSFILKLEIN